MQRYEPRRSCSSSRHLGRLLLEEEFGNKAHGLDGDLRLRVRDGRKERPPVAGSLCVPELVDGEPDEVKGLLEPLARVRIEFLFPCVEDVAGRSRESLCVEGVVERHREVHAIVVRAGPLDEDVTRGRLEEILASARYERGVAVAGASPADVEAERLGEIGAIEVLKRERAEVAILIELKALVAEGGAGV